MFPSRILHRCHAVPWTAAHSAAAGCLLIRKQKSKHSSPALLLFLSGSLLAEAVGTNLPPLLSDTWRAVTNCFLLRLFILNLSLSWWPLFSPGFYFYLCFPSEALLKMKENLFSCNSEQPGFQPLNRTALAGTKWTKIRQLPPCFCNLRTEQNTCLQKKMWALFACSVIEFLL